MTSADLVFRNEEATGSIPVSSTIVSITCTCTPPENHLQQVVFLPEHWEQIAPGGREAAGSSKSADPLRCQAAGASFGSG
jgi:hypothetical protein